jgi:CheY-like chemotaxis protein
MRLSPPEAPAVGAPPICFIVEDEPGIRQVITYSLHDYGIATKEFDNAPAVLSALEHIAPSLCFLDVSLQGSDAIDVIRGLAQHNYRGPVQLMSGKDPALLEEIRRVGERHSLRMLSGAIETVSRRSRAQDRQRSLRRTIDAGHARGVRTTPSVVTLARPGLRSR